MKRKGPQSSSKGTAVEALREPDQFLQETAQNARANFDRCITDLSTYAQREPQKALLSAVAAGYVLRMLPLTGLVRMFLRLAMCLLKPAVIIYGGAKIWEKMQNDTLESTSEKGRSTGAGASFDEPPRAD